MGTGTVTWRYNGKRYMLGVGEKYVYLNGYYCPEGFEILEGLRKTATVEEAKKRAEAFDNLPADKKMKHPPKKFSFSEFMQGIGIRVLFFGGLAFFGYIIYQIWWFFIGDWAFNGPWANDTSAGEVIFETCILFIAFIVVIEEVIRRCINGHF